MKTVLSLFAFLWLAMATASAHEESNTLSSLDAHEGFALHPLGTTAESPLVQVEMPPPKPPATVASSLRGHPASLDVPPIPPIHPVHTGEVDYSSVMEADGTVIYRRDIEAPCDYGMLVFNIGPAGDDLPYPFDLYADAYLWDDNGGLCILYPTYRGYQVSQYGPFWRPGYDATTVKFGDLVEGFKHMHKISSRMLVPQSGAPQHAQQINRDKAGDYVIMAKHNFYDIDYYKRLKAFVNSWGPNGWTPEDDENHQDGWVVSDHTTTTLVSETQ